jgi:hypothetical protein
MKKGSGEILPAKRIESELVATKIRGQKKWFYLAPGINPFVIEYRRGILAKLFGKDSGITKLFGKAEVDRFYLVREGEPFIRDSYSGEHIDPDAMFETMFQQGLIDIHGYLMDPDEKRPFDDDGVITQKEYIELKAVFKKAKEEPTEVQLANKDKLQVAFTNNFDAQGWNKPLYTKEDVGDMEILLDQSLLIFDGKVAQGLSISAKKSLLTARDITMWLIIGANAFTFCFALYFLLKGAGYSV